ncbi:MAG TPA: septation protein A [Burkholderiales bacterium]
MKLLYDLIPLLLFFAAFKAYDIYVATAVVIAATAAQVAVSWLRTRRVETMPLVTLGVLVVFGGLTLGLRDDTFIKWKPTLVYWLLAALVLGSQWLGRATLIERLLGKQIHLPRAVWARQNLAWGVFFAALGVLNLYVAFFFRPDLDPAARQAIWVNFKVFGLLGLTLLFLLIQGVLLARHLNEPPAKNGSGGAAP